MVFKLLYRENRELKAKQAKMSMEAAKTLQADKNIKNKAEKDRRIREQNENNTKKFIEERKRLAMAQSRQMEAMQKHHQGQLVKLNQDMLKVITSRKLFVLALSSDRPGLRPAAVRTEC